MRLGVTRLAPWNDCPLSCHDWENVYILYHNGLVEASLSTLGRDRNFPKKDPKMTVAKAVNVP